MSWIFSTSNQNNPREVQLASPCSSHFHSKRFLQGSWEFALPLCFHCMGIDKDTAFEAAQWPSAFSTIVSMSLNSSKLLNLSVTCWGYSGPTDSLFVCDTAFTFCPSHVSVLAPDAFFLALSTWGCQSSFSSLSTTKLQKASYTASTFPTVVPYQTWFPSNS